LNQSFLDSSVGHASLHIQNIEHFLTIEHIQYIEHFLTIEHIQYIEHFLTFEHIQNIEHFFISDPGSFHCGVQAFRPLGRPSAALATPRFAGFLINL
jgi:hypothetical protein